MSTGEIVGDRGYKVSIELVLSGLALLLALVILFIPTMGLALFLAGIYNGNSFPTRQRPLFEVPNVGGFLRAILILAGLALIGFGAWMQADGRTLQLIRLASTAPPLNFVVHADSYSRGETITLGQKRAVLLKGGQLSGNVALVVDDVHLFRPTELMLIQNVAKYSQLRAAAGADVKVDLEKQGVEVNGKDVMISAPNILLKRKVRKGDKYDFVYQAQHYTLQVCRIDAAVVGSDFISVSIGAKGASGCQ